MKALLFYCALLAAPAAASAPPIALAYAKPATKVAVFFSRATTFAQLATIRQDLQTVDGIVLTYEKLEFSPTGELQKIAFRVDCKDGFTGTASSDDLPSDFSFGFVRDYTSNAKAPFRIGNL